MVNPSVDGAERAGAQAEQEMSWQLYISGYAALLKSPICASNARLKAGLAVQRST